MECKRIKLSLSIDKNTISTNTLCSLFNNIQDRLFHLEFQQPYIIIHNINDDTIIMKGLTDNYYSSSLLYRY